METYSPEDRSWLLGNAREAIAAVLEHRPPAYPVAPADSSAAGFKRGAFVSLHKAGQLRGCIGRMVAAEPLVATIRGMATAAAFDDPRFPPLAGWELEHCVIEISVLSPLKPAKVDDITVGRDGVHLSYSGRSAVFLPQVPAEQGWNRTDYLEHLCRKAGLPPDSYLKDGAVLQTFTAAVFDEAER